MRVGDTKGDKANSESRSGRGGENAATPTVWAETNTHALDGRSNWDWAAYRTEALDAAGKVVATERSYR